jgi:hypothetical protein
VPVLRGRPGSDGLPVGDLRTPHRHGDPVIPREPIDRDLQVEQSHPAKTCLTGLGVDPRAKRWVLEEKTRETTREALPIVRRPRKDGHFDHRLRRSDAPESDG